MKINHLLPIRLEDSGEQYILLVDLLNKRVFNSSGIEFTQFSSDIFKHFDSEPINVLPKIPTDNINKDELLRKIKNV